MKTIALATRNAHKVEEIRSILGESFRYLTLDDFPHAPHVIEDAGTIPGNAMKKSVGLARFLAHHSGLDASPQRWVLADDSGLEVDALNGAPGVHSARFAALDTQDPGNSPDAENKAKLLRLLRDVPDAKRTARFRCVLALTPVLREKKSSASPVCYADELELQTELFEGACEGRIADAPKGQGGFGYDPLFVPQGHDKSFGELPADVKNRLSHRAKALEKLSRFLSGNAL